ncbi:hypothetical protein M1271_05860 [Patescibacteria group bacterium]|nr:hypothetical protein [Patescibacteria group bacterium]MCL5797759.1 hypothetical protein [Patescibacteria group bacterium]
MSRVLYAIAAIGIVGVSDVFRKLASNLKDPFFTKNTVLGLLFSAFGIFLLFSNK